MLKNRAGYWPFPTCQPQGPGLLVWVARCDRAGLGDTGSGCCSSCLAGWRHWWPAGQGFREICLGFSWDSHSKKHGGEGGGMWGAVIWSELLKNLYFLGETPAEDCRSNPFVLARDSKICCLYEPSSQSCSSVSRIYIILHYFALFICSSLDSIFCFASRR